MRKVSLPCGVQLGLTLGLDESDMPAHSQDTITHWLEALLRDKDKALAVATPYLSPGFEERHEYTYHRLDEESRQAILAQDSIMQRDIRSSFSSGRHDSHKQIDVAWQDEPEREFELVDLQWELPIILQKRATDRSIDLFCCYEIGARLVKYTTLFYRLDDINPSETRLHWKTWNFTQTNQTQSWWQTRDRVRIFCEVKSSIPAISALMHQLQIYRRSRTFQFDPACKSVNILAVVAPPHNEAASVCRNHGISFIEYRP